MTMVGSKGKIVLQWLDIHLWLKVWDFLGIYAYNGFAPCYRTYLKKMMSRVILLSVYLFDFIIKVKVEKLGEGTDNF